MTPSVLITLQVAKTGQDKRESSRMQKLVRSENILMYLQEGN
ncbi:hypothetical protein CSC28_2690 [Pseudomonas paraeruginosa]|nr:hypothetical protein CSC28_2690 [Pseudomonas paraeruginosa]